VTYLLVAAMLPYAARDEEVPPAPSGEGGQEQSVVISCCGVLLAGTKNPRPPNRSHSSERASGNLRRHRVDDTPDLDNPVGRKAAEFGVLAHIFRLFGQIDTEDAVVCDIGVHPLDVRRKR